MVKRGWLWKKHRKHKLWKGWHKRYFVLTQQGIQYYRTSKNINSKSNQPRGGITLGRHCRIDPASSDADENRKPSARDKFKFTITVPPARMLCVGGITRADAEQWVKKLREVIQQTTKYDGADGKFDVGAAEDDGDSSSSDEASDDPNSPKLSAAPSTMDATSQSFNLARSDGYNSRFFDGATKHGILAKRSGIIKGWHNRYFILTGNELRYYRMNLKDCNESVSEKTLRNTTRITPQFSIEYGGGTTKGKRGDLFPFSIVGPDFKIKLGAMTREDADSWVSTLKSLTKPAVSEQDRKTPVGSPRGKSRGAASRGASPSGAADRANESGNVAADLMLSGVPSAATSVLGMDGQSTTASAVVSPKADATRSVVSGLRTRRSRSPRTRRGDGVKVHRRQNTMPNLLARDRDATQRSLDSKASLNDSLLSVSQTSINPAALNSQQLVLGWLWKKYTRMSFTGWHQRYFMLSGNCLQYFKDARRKRVLGSVILGQNSSVSFPGTTLVVKKDTTLFQFTVNLDNSKQLSMKSALFLAAPSKDDAKRWSDAIGNAVVAPSSGDNTMFQISDSDDDDDDDERDVLVESKVCMGDRVRLFCTTRYDDSAKGGCVGIIKKPGQGDYLCVPPVGLAVDPELFKEAVFTIMDPSWPRDVRLEDVNDYKGLPCFGKELKYGEAFVLTDSTGRAWCQDGKYAATRQSKAKHDMVLTLVHGDAKHVRGDAVLYRDGGVEIEASLMRTKGKRRRVRNYKRGTSKLVGGYLSCNGTGRDISFTILPGDGSQTLDFCTFGVEVSANGAAPTEVTVGVEEPVRLDDVENGRAAVTFKCKDLADSQTITCNPPDIAALRAKELRAGGAAPGAPLCATTTHPVNDDFAVRVSWSAQAWWAEAGGESAGGGLLESARPILILLAAAASFYNVAINDDVKVVLTTAVLLLALAPILIMISSSGSSDLVPPTPAGQALGPRSLVRWEVTFALVQREDAMRRKEEVGSGGGDAKGTTGADTGAAESGDPAAGGPPPPIYGPLPMNGSTLRYVEDTTDMPNHTWTRSHYNNYKVRAGPNYRRNKKKAPATCQLYDQVGHDVVRVEKRKIDVMNNFQINDPEMVDRFEERMKRYEASRPGDGTGGYDIPVMFAVALAWPEGRPSMVPFAPAPSGSGFVFLQTYILSDWVRADIKDAKSTDPEIDPAAAVPENAKAHGLALWERYYKSPFKSKFRDRMKVLPQLINRGDKRISGFFRTLSKRYHGKPFLSRPQNHFYSGVVEALNTRGDTVRIPYHLCSIDGYDFQLTSRMAIYSSWNCLVYLHIDMGFIIEGETDDELPEILLAHCRMCCIDQDKMNTWYPNAVAPKKTENKTGASTGDSPEATARGGSASSGETASRTEEGKRRRANHRESMSAIQISSREVSALKAAAQRKSRASEI